MPDAPGAAGLGESANHDIDTWLLQEPGWTPEDRAALLGRPVTEPSWQVPQVRRSSTAG